MRALKLVQHFRPDADSMSERLLEKSRSSSRCSDLLKRVPAEEHKRYSVETYCDLVEWMGSLHKLLDRTLFFSLVGYQNASAREFVTPLSTIEVVHEILYSQAT
jgi:hypothetical protein